LATIGGLLTVGVAGFTATLGVYFDTDTQTCFNTAVVYFGTAIVLPDLITSPVLVAVVAVATVSFLGFTARRALNKVFFLDLRMGINDMYNKKIDYIWIFMVGKFFVTWWTIRECRTQTCSQKIFWKVVRNFSNLQNSNGMKHQRSPKHKNSFNVQTIKKSNTTHNRSTNFL
jgi:hypothetical protein